jgi:hypothetical protein
MQYTNSKSKKSQFHKESITRVLVNLLPLFSNNDFCPDHVYPQTDLWLDPEDRSLKWRLYTGGIMLENVLAIYGNKVIAHFKNGWLMAIE